MISKWLLSFLVTSILGALSGCGVSQGSSSSPGISITNATSTWVFADDNNPDPEVNFNVNNVSGGELGNIYIEVHFINPKTNQDYGYQNDDFDLLAGTTKREVFQLNDGISGMTNPTAMDAVVEYMNSNRQMVTIATIPIKSASY